MKLARNFAAAVGSSSAKAEIKAESAGKKHGTSSFDPEFSPLSSAKMGRAPVLFRAPAQERVVSMMDRTNATLEGSTIVDEVADEKEQNNLSEHVTQQATENNPSELAQYAKLSVEESPSSNEEQQLQEYQQQDN